MSNDSLMEKKKLGFHRKLINRDLGFIFYHSFSYLQDGFAVRVLACCLPSFRGSFSSVCLFSLSCWKALLGSNLRRGAPGSFDFSCSRSLFCRVTWERSLDTSYTHVNTARKKRGMKYKPLELERKSVCFCNRLVLFNWEWPVHLGPEAVPPIGTKPISWSVVKIRVKQVLFRVDPGEENAHSLLKNDGDINVCSLERWHCYCGV